MGSQIVAGLFLIMIVLVASVILVPVLISELRSRSINLSKAEQMIARRNVEYLSLTYVDFYAGGIVMWIYNYGHIEVKMNKLYDDRGVALSYTVCKPQDLRSEWGYVDSEGFAESWTYRWSKLDSPILYSRIVNATIESTSNGIHITGYYADEEDGYLRNKFYGAPFEVEFTLTPSLGETSLAVLIHGYHGWIYGVAFNADLEIFDVIYGRNGLIYRMQSGDIQAGYQYTVKIAVDDIRVGIIVSNSTGVIRTIFLPNRDTIYRAGFLQGSSAGSADATLHSVVVSGNIPRAGTLEKVIGPGLWALIIYSANTPRTISLVSSNMGVYSWDVLPRV